MIAKDVLAFSSMWQNQWRSQASLEDMQLSKLKRVIKHAYEDVPYYHELFEKNRIRPQDITSLGDIKRIPLLTKQHLRSRPVEEFLAKGFALEDCIDKRSSGSTGIPTRILLDKKDFTRKYIDLRMHLTNGYNLLDTIVYFLEPDDYQKKEFFFQKLGIFRKRQISILDSPESQLDQLVKINPKCINGYPNTLRLIAELMKKRDIRLRVKLIFTNAELLDDATRKLLSSAFNCDVIDFYGSSEVATCAWECRRHEGYHMNMDTQIVEIIDQDGREAKVGDCGNVVVTTLYNDAMPLIRYSLGDFAVKGSLCSCKRGFGVIRSIYGRNDDYITTESGKRIAPLILGTLIGGYNTLDQYKLVQEDISDVTLYIVKTDAFSDADEKELKRKLNLLFGKGIRLGIRHVPEIVKDPSGKIRRIVSKVK